MRIIAHAKINWVLDITGERPDGYHLMDMLMQPISMADTVTLTEADTISLSVSTQDSAFTPDIPEDDSNLTWRAATMLQAYTGCTRGVKITLEKYIPAKAGLGGGSSDAAAVLLGLNRLWNLALTPEVLAEIALKLGADVPFFLVGGLCRVHGIGEELRIVSRGPKWYVVIIQPCQGLSTKEMFDGFSAVPDVVHPDVEALEQILLQDDISVLPIHPGNVLESVSCSLQPEIGQAAGFLVRSGAVCAQMSGSGSAVFGIFPSKNDAEAAASSARERWDRVYVCQTCEDAISIHP